MKLQLTKDKTIDVKMPWEKSAAGGSFGRRRGPSDVTGVFLGAADPRGCPAVRLQRRKGEVHVAAAGFVPPPDGKLPTSWDDLHDQAKWALPHAFQAPQAALAVYSPDMFIRQTTVDALLSEAEPWMDPVKKQRLEEQAQAPKFSSAVVTMVAIMGIWTMAVLMFVIFWLAVDRVEWLIFASAVPISLVTLLVLNSVWNKGRHNQIIVMLLVACVVALIYLFLLPFNPWQIFLVLIPAEIVVILSFRIRKREPKKT